MDYKIVAVISIITEADNEKEVRMEFEERLRDAFPMTEGVIILKLVEEKK